MNARSSTSKAPEAAGEGRSRCGRTRGQARDTLDSGADRPVPMPNLKPPYREDPARRELQCGHATPVGHRRAMNQASAVASSGNMPKIWTRLMPSRYLFPGALCAMPVSS